MLENYAVKFNIAIKTNFQCFASHIQMRNCKSWVFSLVIGSHEANSEETAFEGRIWVWKIQVLVTSGEIIMQTFRDQTQKNVKMSFKELSHPPPEKCNSHVQAPPSYHFMQKTNLSLRR